MNYVGPLYIDAIVVRRIRIGDVDCVDKWLIHSLDGDCVEEDD